VNEKIMHNSEIYAEHVLKKLGFKDLLFKGKPYDFENSDAIIEVKSFYDYNKRNQLKRIVKNTTKDVFLLFVDDRTKEFCLFKLVKSHIKAIKVKKSKKRQKETKSKKSKERSIWALKYAEAWGVHKLRYLLTTKEGD